MRVIVGLPYVCFTYAGLLARRCERAERLKPGINVADLMFDMQGRHWLSVPNAG
ncbi:hypothetical protein LAUMK7_02951 [Mycobacterium kansasii]|uniref:Uncharacterized protein n=2 Tax=Mycobacterium kansasii TaxID=1768 RepID=A0A653EY48_MYCKA|nr:hypothetical protein MKAN_28395 [Mycobacterium kansasii ATCC 12478]VAZ60537.1 hypothetical protein LAUMK22_02344 [Mycobacterium kansasii]VAZ66857.1 hypothetical protein LAUMK40_02994 [Mycobacterium kansasii]VAZ75614.1 hypothetical protein LAUMK7_02951 [Mycobacterium kansasii]VTP02330.1 hypothetical protein BIN_B_03404 [Mycobacterium kansasii]